MDLVIDAKDKEQAVYEVMRTFKLPGFDSIHDMIPHLREDENHAQAAMPSREKKLVMVQREKEEKRSRGGRGEAECGVTGGFCHGRPENQVYLSLGMEERLKPRKRPPTGTRLDRGF